jgi:hypothetical protein
MKLGYPVLKKTKNNKAACLAILTKFITSRIYDTHDSDVSFNLALINPKIYRVLL